MLVEWLYPGGVSDDPVCTTGNLGSQVAISGCCHDLWCGGKIAAPLHKVGRIKAAWFRRSENDGFQAKASECRPQRDNACKDHPLEVGMVEITR